MHRTLCFVNSDFFYFLLKKINPKIFYLLKSVLRYNFHMNAENFSGEDPKNSELKQKPSAFFRRGKADAFVYELSKPVFSHRSDQLKQSKWTSADRKLLVSLVQAFPADAEIDWSAVSSGLSHRHSPIECLMQYRNVDDPSINKGPWDLLEIERMIQLVHDKGYSWVECAEALNTRRTPLQCLQHYQVSVVLYTFRDFIVMFCSAATFK